jgi:hypothetical protein
VVSERLRREITRYVASLPDPRPGNVIRHGIRTPFWSAPLGVDGFKLPV